MRILRIQGEAERVLVLHFAEEYPQGRPFRGCPVPKRGLEENSLSVSIVIGQGVTGLC